MNGGRIVLADEPTGALDSKSGVEVMALLQDLSRRGHTVILITHALEAAKQAKRVIEVRDGRIVSDPGPQFSAGPAAPDTAKLGEEQRSHEGGALFVGGAFEAAKTAVRALRSNLFRTVLTLLGIGIVIGVASVIAMLAIGDAAKQIVLDRISAMGSPAGPISRAPRRNSRRRMPTSPRRAQRCYRRSSLPDRMGVNILAPMYDNEQTLRWRSGESVAREKLDRSRSEHRAARNVYITHEEHMNKILSRQNSLLAISAIALSLASLNVVAEDQKPQGVQGYWTEPATNDMVWRNGFGECWRSFNPTDTAATGGCDPVVPPRAAAPAPVAQAPAPAPVAPAPAPRPVPVNMKISLSADALFDFDKSVIKPEGKAHLDALVGQLQKVDLEKLTAVGHTDSKGSDAYNEKLALRRVHAVEAYLVSRGIPDNRIAASGMGEKAPVAPNMINGKDNPEGRAKNRRVEIEVVGTETR